MSTTRFESEIEDMEYNPVRDWIFIAIRMEENKNPVRDETEALYSLDSIRGIERMRKRMLQHITYK